MQLSNDSAIKMTLELTKENIESTSEWTKPEDVIKFMDDIYSYFRESKDSEK